MTWDISQRPLLLIRFIRINRELKHVLPLIRYLKTLILTAIEVILGDSKSFERFYHHQREDFSSRAKQPINQNNLRQRKGLWCFCCVNLFFIVHFYRLVMNYILATWRKFYCLIYYSQCVPASLASHADVLRLVTSSSPRTSAEMSDHFRSLAISQS